MKKVQDFKVKNYRWLNDTNYIINLQSDQPIADIAAGNFAEVEIPNASDVFLRRPFSVLDADLDQNILSFYVKVIGKGTRKLGQYIEGEDISVIYPLGNSFSINGNKNVLIVGGGSGIAPFILLGRELKKKNIKTTFLFGARSKSDIVLTDDFKELGEVFVTTEDGSLGEKGLVTQHPIFSGDFSYDRIYTCGPDPMMKAIGKIAKERGIDCEVSLENMMACGFGACLCCVTETTSGNKCVCTEGPVFNVNDLAW